MSDATLNGGLNIALAFVLLGVVLEGAEIVEEIRKRGWKPRNCFKLVANVGFALLVIGLGVEWYFSTAIQKRDAGHISDQQKVIKSQNDKIIVLERTLAPRHWHGMANGYSLGAPTQESLWENSQIDSALTGFHGVTALIQVIPQYEAIRFAREVARALSEAGWSVKDLDVTTSHIEPFNMPDGVQLWTGAKQDEAWRAAEALQKSMSVHGIYGESFGEKLHSLPGSLLVPKDDIRSSPPDGTVVILIGDRPGYAELLKIEGDEYRAAHPGEK